MKNSNKSLIIIFFLSLFFTILAIFLYSNFQNKIAKNYIQNVINSECYPIRKNYVNKYYEIDNEFYPKSLLLHQNKSINFKCLNQNKKIKIILFWTKYYGYRFKFIF
jgi:hypothetical protein